MEEIFNTYWPIITSVITAATAISMVTKTKWDNKILDILSKIVNALAGNFLKNTNKDA